MPGASDAVGMASESRDSATASQARNRISELLTISNLFLDHTPHGRTMRYFVGQFNPKRLHRRRTFAAVAGGGAGRAEGFVVCTPYRDGKAWGIEMYRARPDAIRGTIPFLIHATMQALKCEGIEEVSLCLMPAAGCSTRRHPPYQDSWFIHTYIHITHQYLNFILDTPGIYHFKTRFRPRSENIYCGIWPSPTTMAGSIRPLHAMLSTWGTLEFSPWRAVRRALSRVRNRRQRATLTHS